MNVLWKELLDNFLKDSPFPTPLHLQLSIFSPPTPHIRDLDTQAYLFPGLTDHQSHTKFLPQNSDLDYGEMASRTESTGFASGKPWTSYLAPLGLLSIAKSDY